MSRTGPVAKKALGQYWLNHQVSLKAICLAADIKTDDVVLEIGPGTGELTAVLADCGARVLALEYDQDLIPGLRQKFAGADVEIAHGDIRTFNLTELPRDYKIVANIPYYLTAYFLRLLTETSNKPSQAALLVQKEVAERVASKPGQMSFISLATQLFYAASLGPVVPAKLFTPPPKVDSQVLILKKLEVPLFNADYNQLLKFIKTGFSQPRKTLVNNLSSLQGLERAKLEADLSSLGLSVTVRAQELSLQDWYNLHLHL